MLLQDEIRKPSKDEQLAAMASYDALAATLRELKSQNPEIEIEETGEKITIPLRALKLLGNILKAMSMGNPIQIVPIATEVTTQVAAEMLGCSRPHLVKLIESGKIAFTKVGKHRRVLYQDVLNYKRKMKEEQKAAIINIIKADEESNMYDT